MLEAKNWIKKVYWEDVRDQVAAVNPEFAAEVDKLSPGKDLPLYLAQYRFGESILKDGMFQIPDHKGNLLPRIDPDLNVEVNEAFSYALSMPIGVVLSKQLEIHGLYQDVALSWRCMQAGSIFALWSLLGKKLSSHSGGAMWQITSGARSLVMLPRVAYTRFFKRLQKEFHLTLKSPPEKLTEQWVLLSALANSAEFDSSWTSEVVFFTKSWYEKINDPSWEKFKLFLYEKAWDDTSWTRDQIIFEYANSTAFKKCNLKPNPYLADIVKYLYHIADNIYPVFKIATDDNAAPIDKYQKIFSDIYGLENAPLMAHFASINALPPESALYYSLEFPTQVIFSPRSSQRETKLDDLRQIKHIQETTQKYFATDELKLKGLPLYDTMVNSKFEYFHNVEDAKEGILSSYDLPVIDKDIKKELERFSNKDFCAASPFFRGCVRISKK